MIYPQPSNEDEFEEFCLRFYRKHLQREGLSRYGKRGERQDGIDIFDQLNMTPVVAIQCKHHEPTKQLTATEIQDEVKKAKGSVIKLNRYIIVTSARRSRRAHDTVVALNADGQVKFQVEVHFWEDICSWLDLFILPLALEIVYGRNIVAEAARSQSWLSLPNNTEVLSQHRQSSRADERLVFSVVEQLLQERKIDLAAHELSQTPEPTLENGSSRELRYAWNRLRGKLAIEAGDFSEASSCFLAAYQACPDSDQAKQNHVLALDLRGDQVGAYELACKYADAGLKTYTIATLLVQTIGSVREIGKHEALIGEYLPTDENLNVSLAHRYSHESEFDLGRQYADRALGISPESAHAHFAMAACLHQDAVRGEWRTAKRNLKRAIEHYDLAGRFALEQNYGSLIQEVLLNRATAKHLLGDPSAAIDFREAVKRCVSNSAVVERAVSYFLCVEDFNSAWELQAHLNLDRPESQFLASVTETEVGNEQQVRLSIGKLISLANVEWKRAGESRINAVQNAIRLGDLELAKAMTQDVPASLGSEMLRLTLSAWIACEEEHQVLARELAMDALKNVPEAPDVSLVRLLAQILVRLNDDANALVLFELITTKGRLDHDCKSLIRSAQRCGRHDVLICVCRELREAGQQDEKLRRLEIQLLSQYSPEQAFPLCGEFEAVSDSPAYFRAWHNVIAATLNKPEEIKLQRGLLPSPRELSTRECRLVVFPYLYTKQYLEAVDFLYQHLQANFDSEDAHGSYVAAFLQYSDKLTCDLRPEQVALNCAAMIIDEVGKHQWVGIDDENVSPSRGWFSSSDSISEVILGKRVGSAVQLPGAFVKGRSAVVREIQSKYVRAFQDSIAKFQTRFPGSSVIQEVIVERNGVFDPSVIVESLRQRQGHVEHCMKVYREELCSLYLLSKQLGVNEFQSLKAVSQREPRFVRCCQVSPREFQAKSSSNVRGSAITIDISAICTMSLFNLWDLLDENIELYVSRSTMDTIENWITLCRESKASGVMLLDSLGQPTIVEKSEDDHHGEIAELEGLKFAVMKHCKIFLSTRIASIPQKTRDLYLKTVGYHNIETICVANEHGTMLWTDDFLTAIVANADFGVSRTWTQMALHQSGTQLDPDGLDKTAAKLAAANYVNTIWNSGTLIAGGRLSDRNPDAWPFKECLALLGKNDTPLPLRSRIVLEFLKALRRSECSELMQSAVIQRVLHNLANSGAVQWIHSELVELFGLDFPSARFVCFELDYWLRTNS